MEKTFKILICMALFIGGLMYVGCAEQDAAADTKRESIEYVRALMDTQKVSLEKLEASKGPTGATRAAADTLTAYPLGDWWPLCGTRRAAIIRQIMEDKGITIEDLKE
jgi:hypothetical protein